MSAWTWEYFAEQYVIRRIDGTKGVAYIAPRTPANNVAASSLCEFLQDEGADARYLAAQFAVALKAERAYRSNNTGENASRRKAALAALPKGWEKS